MAALVLRAMASLQVTRQVVEWYAGRAWTLWVLLVLLPLFALLLGCGALLLDGSLAGRVYASPAETVGTGMAPGKAAGLNITPAMWMIAVETLAAGLILAVVSVHVMMN